MKTYKINKFVMLPEKKNLIMISNTDMQVHMVE